ncbi:MAG TPA: hypothetical protein VKV80_01170 [Streptosporangiaceae bacterium]|nr:hypothetical protein [Streptosporangiaceae bacterium]
MKRGRLASAIAALAVPALGLGLGLGLGVSQSAAASPRAVPVPATAAHAVSRASAGPVVINCLGKPQVRPGTIVLACADGNDYLGALSWTSWTQPLASATGTQHENDCIPSCAAGHFHSYPVLVVLWRSAPVTGHPGLRRYTMITLIYPGARPRVYNGHKWVEGPGTVTMPLWAPPV